MNIQFIFKFHFARYSLHTYRIYSFFNPQKKEIHVEWITQCMHTHTHTFPLCDLSQHRTKTNNVHVYEFFYAFAKKSLYDFLSQIIAFSKEFTHKKNTFKMDLNK